eukprot:4050314-Prymnesium_polylepis.1
MSTLSLKACTPIVRQCDSNDVPSQTPAAGCASNSPIDWAPSWRMHSEVQLDTAQVIGGEVDVLTVLKLLPQERVRRMQQTIAEHAQSMHYAFDDIAGAGDALELTLNLLAASADNHDREGLQ